MVYTRRHAFEKAYAWNSLAFVGKTVVGGAAMTPGAFTLICACPSEISTDYVVVSADAKPGV